MNPPKTPTVKQAIECLEIVSTQYKLKFTIHYIPKSLPWNNPGWKIKMMDKVFYSVDFIEAAGKAVSFVYNAHQGTTVERSVASNDTQ